MKKYFLFAVVATIAVLSTGCFATTSGTTSTTKGRTKIETPLSDAKYMSDQNYFRVVELGVSPDLSAALKTARINARTELAATVETAVKAVITSYTQSTATQAESLYEGLATNVVNNKLSGAIEIAKEAYQTEDGRYEYYVCFELSKQELKDALANEMANDATLKAQFDRQRFMDTYNRELANY
ncbi:MAG: hypothetical protein J6U93_01255 [Alistipes sp.]|nr:hypothetical protein [Alistipes sp.]